MGSVVSQVGRDTPNRASLSGRRILIVEDEALIALELQDALLDRGATVIGPAGSPSAALAEIERSDIDGALLDIKLGEENVAAIAAALEKLDVPMIFVTAYSDARLPKGFEQRPLVQKPYDRQRLLNLIASIFQSDD